jgi:hypothetical protein
LNNFHLKKAEFADFCKKYVNSARLVKKPAGFRNKSIVELSLKGYSCRFILMADPLSLLQTETYNNGADSKVIAVLRSVDFLVIDDAFDPRKATVYKSGYQFSFLDTFLRYRLETVTKAVCFTSNVPIDEIAKNWTPSIASLVRRSVPAPMEFSDYITNFKAEDIWA